jgi:hypothetical protein
MIEFVFTIDYEIYGDGTGALDGLVYQPARRLQELFRDYDARFVAFVEVAEFEQIEAQGTDPAIDAVIGQIRDFYRTGFEIALHLHPQWFNARYAGGRWDLDLSEYNLCTLSRPRIEEIAERSLAYLRYAVDDRAFTPISFRAGNWLFQPTRAAADVLAGKGIRIDSSVFKGGVQRNNSLDYRPALKNGYYWPFSADVNQPDPLGAWVEVPIHTEMVPSWKLLTAKRMSYPNQFGVARHSARRKLVRAFDFLRFRYPLKLDFCRMTLQELTQMMERVIREDRTDPQSYRPIVAIGHTKDLTDFDTVKSFLEFLKASRITVSTFADIYPKLAGPASSDCRSVPVASSFAS